MKKLNINKNEELVKKDIKKIIIPPYHVRDVVRAAIICRADSSNKIDQKYIPFFYRSRDEINYYALNTVSLFNLKTETAATELKEYLENIKNKFRYALGFPAKEQFIQDSIDVIDGDVDEKQRNILPRSKKLFRLRKFHINVIEFALKMLHDYFWMDITNNKTNDEELSYYINKIIPVIVNLVDNFYKEIDDEYPLHIIDKQLKIEYYKN